MGLFGMFGKAARMKRLVQETDDLHERFAEELAQCPGPNWEFEVVTDSRGKVLASGWKHNPPPDRYERNGLRNLGPYVKRLLESENWYSSVSISSTDGEKGLLIQKKEDNVSITLCISRSAEPGREVHARAFFEEMGIEPSLDYEIEGISAGEGSQMLEWPVTIDADHLTDLLVRCATEIYSITDEEPIDLQFEECEDEGDRYKGEITLHTLYPTTHPDETAT